MNWNNDNNRESSLSVYLYYLVSSVSVDPPYILCFIFERDDKLLHLEDGRWRREGPLSSPASWACHQRWPGPGAEGLRRWSGKNWGSARWRHVTSSFYSVISCCVLVTMQFKFWYLQMFNVSFLIFLSKTSFTMAWFSAQLLYLCFVTKYNLHKCLQHFPIDCVSPEKSLSIIPSHQTAAQQHQYQHRNNNTHNI